MFEKYSSETLQIKNDKTKPGNTERDAKLENNHTIQTNTLCVENYYRKRIFLISTASKVNYS